MLRRALGVLLFFIGRLGSPPEKDDTCVQRGGEGVRNAVWIKIMPTKGEKQARSLWSRPRGLVFKK